MNTATPESFLEPVTLVQTGSIERVFGLSHEKRFADFMLLLRCYRMGTLQTADDLPQTSLKQCGECLMNSWTGELLGFGL